MEIDLWSRFQNSLSLSALHYGPVDLGITISVSLSWQSNGAHTSFSVLTCHSFTYHLTFLFLSLWVYFLLCTFHAIILHFLHITDFSPLAVSSPPFPAVLRSLHRWTVKCCQTESCICFNHILYHDKHHHVQSSHCLPHTHLISYRIKLADFQSCIVYVLSVFIAFLLSFCFSIRSSICAPLCASPVSFTLSLSLLYFLGSVSVNPVHPPISSELKAGW